jgi:hypothetical protein
MNSLTRCKCLHPDRQLPGSTHTHTCRHTSLSFLQTFHQFLHSDCENHSDGLRTGRLVIDSRQRREILIYSVLGLSLLPIQCVQWTLSWRVKRLEREAGRTLPSSAEIKNDGGALSPPTVLSGQLYLLPSGVSAARQRPIVRDWRQLQEPNPTQTRFA